MGQAMCQPGADGGGQDPHPKKDVTAERGEFLSTRLHLTSRRQQRPLATDPRYHTSSGRKVCTVYKTHPQSLLNGLSVSVFGCVYVHKLHLT